MVKVKMYAEVEGDARVGDEVDVDKDRAEFLVVSGHATYVNESDAVHLPPVGGARLEGRKAGVEPPTGAKGKKRRETAAAETAKSPAGQGVKNAPAEGTAKPAEEEGAKVGRGGDAT